MSGGTDSSVAAMKLQDAGYQVTGITFRFFEKEGETAYLEEARRLATQLGIRHITIDVRQQFRKTIIDYFINEYMNGHTPVPCTRCNNLLKWPLLAKTADELGIYHIATGHYARRIEQDGIFLLAPATDKDKDQSFFLWGLSQQLLARIVLPMGDVRKNEARAYAHQRGFEQIATKHDSIGVCFCPKDYHSFLRKELSTGLLPGKGRFIDEEGNFIGWHEGYPFYTIGQRRGLGLQLNTPIFVKEINPKRNEVTLAPLRSLYKNEFYLEDWNLAHPSLVLNVPEVIVKIRYRKQANRCQVSVDEQSRQLHVQLIEPLESIAIGQAAAFYTNEGVLLGGGIITEKHSL